MNAKSVCCLLLLAYGVPADGFASAIRPWGHYSTIGFPTSTESPRAEEEATVNLWKALLQDDTFTEEVNVKPLVYRSSTPSGTEMWCAVNDDNKVVGFEPHFLAFRGCHQSKSLISIRICLAWKRGSKHANTDSPWSLLVPTLLFTKTS